MQPQSLVFLLLAAGFLYLMFSRSRRQQRSAQQMQAGVVPGTKIVTTAGLYATVVEIDGQTVTLETAPGQHSQWDRRAIARVLPDQTLAERAVNDEDEEDTDDDMEDGTGAAGTASTSQETAPPDRA
jgi:preprotein translocase subunit YajC